VYSAPDLESALRGRIAPDESFTVLEVVGGPGCDGAGWGLVEGEGYVCLEDSTPSTAAPIHLPRLVAFVHPDPTEFDEYLETMRYNRTPEEGISAMVPFIYAKRWRGWKAPNYASAEAFANGDAPLSRLGGLRKYHFIRTEETPRGTVLTRANGRVVPVDEVHVYPLSKFRGWDLTREPMPSEMLPAWAVGYDGTPVYTAPDSGSEVGRTLPYHTSLVISLEPVDEQGHWWEMKDGLGPDQPGYVNDTSGIRHWVPSPPPPGIAEDEMWIDVVLDQQVLAIRRGEATEYVTLVSTGAPGWSTPRGLYRMYDKTIYGDMQSRDDAEKPYYVEKVPWIMHFWPRYALHGVFWHWGFGHRASHGCINMSVRDARHLFDRITPTTHDGWMTAYASPDEVGTTLRVRRDTEIVRDRRR